MRYDFGYFEEDHLGQTAEVHLWQRIMGYVRPFWWEVAGALALSLIITGAGLGLPALLRAAVDNYIVNQGLTTPARLAGVARLAGIFLALLGLEFVANFLQVVLLEWTGQRVMHRMRQQLFTHMLDLNLSFYNRNPVGKLVTRLTNDIQNMHEMFTSVIVTLFNDLIRLTGILAILFWMNWQLALGMCLLVPAILGNTLWFSRLARDAFRRIRTGLARINSFLQEALSGVALIQLFNREPYSRERFQALNRAYLDDTLYQIKVFGIFMPVVEILAMAATALIIWYGGSEILRGDMTIGVLVAFLAYMRLFFQPLRELSQKYSIVQSAMASAERIFQLLDTEESLPIAKTPELPAGDAGTVVFQNVTFGYAPGQPVLRDLSFTVPPGETLAIVGATGSGKSTIINLLERLYDPEAGAITVDGTDLRQLDPAWLRRHVGLVMQDVFIVPDTLRANILLDRLDLDDAELTTIVSRAQLTALVRQLPQGWHTRLGEGGMELSAGQKQLLAFARVLARDPAILVLDEATSNVDTETEILIERAIDTALAGRTSMVIAHRLSTIRRAHRILVMTEGRIVEQGTHESLMAAGGLYHHLQSLQVRDCVPS
ncbi:MAG: ABC transporter ATP-binding protein [Desulfobacterales bacterium CG2_30_60_27]|nr:MAG: ABC transporter ATP-binding protein [Desulfobacterales bacterium CG2_30_60_27]